MLLTLSKLFSLLLTVLSAHLCPVNPITPLYPLNEHSLNKNRTTRNLNSLSLRKRRLRGSLECYECFKSCWRELWNQLQTPLISFNFEYFWIKNLFNPFWLINNFKIDFFHNQNKSSRARNNLAEDDYSFSEFHPGKQSLFSQIGKNLPKSKNIKIHPLNLEVIVVVNFCCCIVTHKSAWLRLYIFFKSILSAMLLDTLRWLTLFWLKFNHFFLIRVVWLTQIHFDYMPRA